MQLRGGGGGGEEKKNDNEKRSIDEPLCELLAAFICGKSIILDAKGQLQSGKQSSKCISYFVAGSYRPVISLILAVVAYRVFLLKGD